MPYLFINRLKDVAEVGDKVLLEQFIVGTTDVLTDGVDKVHQGEHAIWLDLLEPLLDDSGHHLRMLHLLLGDFCEGVYHNLVVEGERGQSFPVLIRHLFVQPHKIHFGELLTRTV